jgi:hypothetical protein
VNAIVPNSPPVMVRQTSFYEAPGEIPAAAGVDHDKYLFTPLPYPTICRSYVRLGELSGD